MHERNFSFEKQFRELSGGLKYFKNYLSNNEKGLVYQKNRLRKSPGIKGN